MLETSEIKPIELLKNRGELYAAHRDRYRCFFAADGSWVGPHARDQVDQAREWLWHALAFLSGDENDVELANKILAATPNVANHFNPVVAVQILVRDVARLSGPARDHLLRIVLDGIPEAVDFSLATAGLNNFTMMRAMFFLLASQCVQYYEPQYTHRSIEDVYNHYRLRQFGRNILSLIELQLERSQLSHEFNSPTYSPICLLAAAEIVNLVDDEPSVKVATRIEDRLWDELSIFYHPRLDQTTGPMSRGYFVDRIGHASNWRILCSLIGLSQSSSVQDLLYPPRKGQVSHGDLISEQAIACWFARPDYHPPADWRQRLDQRQYPYESTALYEWPGYGCRRPDGTLVTNVEGEDAVSAGKGSVHLYQDKNFALGSMSKNYSPQNVPCHVVYQITEPLEAIDSTRSGYILLSRSDNSSPVPSECGAFETSQQGATVCGTVSPWHWLTDEGASYCLSLAISEHLPPTQPVDQVLFGGKPVGFEQTLSIVRSGCFQIHDRGCELIFEVFSSGQIEFIATRQDGMLLCSAIWSVSGKDQPLFNFKFTCDWTNKRSADQ